MRETARVTITGGKGFLGRHVEAELRRRGYAEVFPLDDQDYDLVDTAGAQRMYTETRPTHVIHLAAAVGGIGANVANPGWFSYANTMMGANVIEGARRHGARKLVTIGTICVYPQDAPVPTPESAVWEGFPAPDTAPYGVAKRNLIMMSQAYRRQYGLNAVYVIPTNLYGPHDHFAPEKSHVIPAIIRRFLEAKAEGRPQEVAWGDGTATRDFLYVEDAARGIVDTLERYDEAEPMNLATGVETTMRELVEAVAAATGYEGRVVWDPTKPTGAPRRSLDITRARTLLGFAPEVDVTEGIRRTVEWYVGENDSGTE